MPATGELIRLMNYVDDIAATLRRINSSLPTMTAEERKRLAEYIHKSEPSLSSVVESLVSAGVPAVCATTARSSSRWFEAATRRETVWLGVFEVKR